MNKRNRRATDKLSCLLVLAALLRSKSSTAFQSSNIPGFRFFCSNRLSFFFMNIKASVHPVFSSKYPVLKSPIFRQNGITGVGVERARARDQEAREKSWAHNSWAQKLGWPGLDSQSSISFSLWLKQAQSLWTWTFKQGKLTRALKMNKPVNM